MDEHVPNSTEWVLFRATATDRPFYWNRRTNATAWKPPPGINVVWVGEKLEGEESGTGTRLPVPVHMTSLLCLLSEALRGEGLGIPSPLPGCLWLRSLLMAVARLWLVFWFRAVFPLVVGRPELPGPDA